jgi:hypothetical protein
MVDERGLVRDLDADERLHLANEIGKINNVVDLAAGDLINQECKARGLKELTKRRVEESGVQEYPTLSPILSAMNYTLKTAANYASIARAFPRSERVSGLGLAHYRAVQGMDSSTDARRKLLQEAQMGRQKKDGTWVKPHPVSWLKKRRMAIEGNTLVDSQLQLSETTQDSIDSAIPGITRALTGLTPDKKKTVMGKVERLLTKEAKKLEKGFSEAVDTQVASMLGPMEAKLRAREKDNATERVRIKEMRENIKTTITKAEFKSLRQFCHPDKHGGSSTAVKVYEIVSKIGVKLGFTT